MFRPWSSELHILDLKFGFYAKKWPRNWILKSGRWKVSENAHIEVVVIFFYLKKFNLHSSCVFAVAEGAKVFRKLGESAGIHFR